MSESDPRPGPDVPGALRPLAEGRYVDFTPVGEGGMGIVYWAVDSDLKRQVAFKIVRPPQDAPGTDVTPPLPYALRAPDEESDVSEAYDHLTARFLQEAWVTGGMEHPGIVPVYELGQTQAGVPYYTMKFVRGNRTLRTAIDEVRQAPMEERLKLLDAFLRVCDTIRYAHSRGVIHRDLKPDNVGLGEYGEVVVLDWGLAKLTDEDRSDLSRWQGEVHAFREEGRLETMPSAVGTPGYMAPEAALGLTDVLDERCDVYSLGIILFEILTGKLPFPCEKFREYQERLRTEQAPNASTFDPTVPATLAEICTHALTRELGKRTPSVEVLANAVRLWQDQRLRDREIAVLIDEAESGLRACRDGLEGEALSTQADRIAIACRRVLELRSDHADARRLLDEAQGLRELGVRERERVARSKALRKAAGVGLAIAAVGAGVVAWMLEDKRQEAESARESAARARTRAVADRERAEDVMGFMVGDLQENLQALGRLDVLARLGREARDYFERIPKEDVNPRSLQNGTRALLNLGDVHTDMGDLPVAMKTYEAAGRIAARLPDDEIGRALRNSVRARVGKVLIQQGFYRKALALLAPAVEELESDGWADAPDRREAVAETHALLGLARTGELNVKDARPHQSKAIAIARALAREARDDAERQATLVRYLQSQRRTFLLAGKAAALKEIAGEAAGIVEVWRAKAPKDVRWMRAEADISITRAERALWGDNDAPAAHQYYEAARATYARLYEIDPLNATYLSTLGFLESRLGRTLGTSDGYAAHWQRAYEIQEQLVSKDPTNATWLHRMVNLADPMAQIAQERPGGANPASYRAAAVKYAKRLVAVDADNPLARHLYAYALNREASDHPPEVKRAKLLEVIRICEDLIEKHKRGFIELGVLSFWAANAIDNANANGEPAVLRRALALVERCIAQTPTIEGDAGQLHDARLDLHLDLTPHLVAEGNVAKARARLRAGLARIDEQRPAATADRRASLDKKRERATEALESLKDQGSD